MYSIAQAEGRRVLEVAAEVVADLQDERRADALARVEERVAHGRLEPRGDAALGQEPLQRGFEGPARRLVDHFEATMR